MAPCLKPHLRLFSREHGVGEGGGQVGCHVITPDGGGELDVYHIGAALGAHASCRARSQSSRGRLLGLGLLLLRLLLLRLLLRLDSSSRNRGIAELELDQRAVGV